MGWFTSSTSSTSSEPSSSPPSSQDDPLSNLDPSLREFLSKESPEEHAPPFSSSSSSPSPDTHSTTPTTEASPPTLFPDGRYAHLWSTYRSQREVELEAKTDQDRLLDVLHDFKKRKAAVGRAAVENCVMEQLQINDCYENGSWAKRMKLCREENRAFERCYMMQSRFLKALGYLTDPNRSAATEEEIQMHADTLFHRMLSQEAAIAKAKADSAPIPTFPSVLASPNSMVPHSPSTFQAVAKEGEEVTLPPPKFPRDPSNDYLNPAAREALNARLAKMSPEEREIEEYALEVESRHEVKVGREVGKIIDERERQRQERRERGTATVIDTITGWFKW